jgi:phosphoglycerate kinase
MSHLGRPNGKPEAKSSLKPIAVILGELLGREVLFLNDCVGEETVKVCQSLNNGQIVLLENLRFHIEEEISITEDNGNKVKAKDEDVAKFREDLTKLGDIFINDAFGTAHRPHSSMVGINLSVRASGLLMNKEISYFAKALETPQTPFLVIMGGAKVKDKIKLVMNLLEKCTDMIIAGGLTFTFLSHIKGMKIGKSIFDKDGVKLIDEIMKKVTKF